MCLHLLVTNFIVKQLEVRPEQIKKFPIDGKTTCNLLMFNEGAVHKMIWKFPHNWIKLMWGFGCHFMCPLNWFSSSIPSIISHVPASLNESIIKKFLEREPFIWKAMEFWRVILESGVKTDKVKVMITVVKLDNIPVSKKMEKLRFKFDVHGFSHSLIRWGACMVCGFNKHQNSHCDLKHRLFWWISRNGPSWTWWTRRQRRMLCLLWKSWMR